MMRSSARCKFPAELIDFIIDGLVGDIPSLKAGSLVCRAWLPRCRKYLHRRVRVGIRHADPSILDRVFARYESADLRALVQMLFLVPLGYASGDDLATSLRALLVHFPEVKHIVISQKRMRSRGSTIMEPVGLELPYPQDMVLFLFRINFTTRAQFYHLLDSVPTLSRLILKGIHFDTYTMFQPTRQPFLANLRHISFDNEHSLYNADFDSLHKWLDADHAQLPLESVSFRGYVSPDMLETFLAACGSSLHSLDIETYHGHIRVIPLPLSTNKELRTLRLRDRWDGNIADVVASLPAGPLPSLASLSIIVETYTVDDSAMAEWDRLDDVLASASTFPCLARLHITLLLAQEGWDVHPMFQWFFTVPDDAVLAEIGDAVRARLTKVQERCACEIVVQNPPL